MSQWTSACTKKGGIVRLTLALAAIAGCESCKSDAKTKGASSSGAPVASVAPSSVAAPAVVEKACDEAVLQPGQCLPSLAYKRSTSVVAWFRRAGVTDETEQKVIVDKETEGCLQFSLGPAAEPAIACVREERVPVMSTPSTSSPVMLNLVLEVLVARESKVVVAMSAPLGVRSSDGPVLFQASWKTDGPGKAIDLSPSAEDCAAAPARLEAFWATRAMDPDPAVKQAIAAEKKLGAARVAAVCSAPKHYAIK